MDITATAPSHHAWYMNLAGKSKRGAMFGFNSSWGSPGRWRLNVCTPDRRYVFAPLETCEVQERGAAATRVIEPDEVDQKFKPGFYEQAKLFLKMIDDRQPPAGLELAVALPSVRLGEQLIAACLKSESAAG
jgi:hypothetical protein